MFGPDYSYAIAIPYLQFPRLNHGRPVMRDKTTAYVKWYDVNNTLFDVLSLFDFWKRAGQFGMEHPNGPFTHGEFSAILDHDDMVDRYGDFLQLYLPMVTDDTVVRAELHKTSFLQDPNVPEDIIALLFTNEKQYLTFTNLAKTPWQAVLKDEWTDRRAGTRSHVFTVPPEQIIFLEK